MKISIASSIKKIFCPSLQTSSSPARGADHDVGAVVLQDLLVLGDGQTSKEHSDLRKNSAKAPSEVDSLASFILMCICAAQFQMAQS